MEASLGFLLERFIMLRALLYAKFVGVEDAWRPSFQVWGQRRHVPMGPFNRSQFIVNFVSISWFWVLLLWVVRMAANEGWRANADTHKMTPEEVEKLGLQASKRPPGHHPGGVLHQRGRLGLSMFGTVGGILFVVGLGVLALYVQSNPEKTAPETAKPR